MLRVTWKRSRIKTILNRPITNQRYTLFLSYVYTRIHKRTHTCSSNPDFKKNYHKYPRLTFLSILHPYITHTHTHTHTHKHTQTTNKQTHTNTNTHTITKTYIHTCILHEHTNSHAHTRKHPLNPCNKTKTNFHIILV